MLSSPRWTVVDLFLIVALVALTSKVFSYEARIERAVDRGNARLIALTDTLSVPMPAPVVAASMGRLVQLDVTLRCTGLAQFQRDIACRMTPGAQCQRAEIAVRDIESSLWPKGRVGQFATAFRQRAGAYSRAYAALEGRGQASSELILSRDSAMCTRYHLKTEARVHERTIRQPG